MTNRRTLLPTARLLPGLVALAAAVSTIAVVPAPAAATPETRPGGEVSLPVQGVDRAAARTAPAAPRADALGAAGGADSTTVALTAARDTDPFRLVGVTWSGRRSDVAVWVRTRDGAGWSAWQELAVEDAHGPDPSTGESTRAGTEPLLVRESDGVQVRIDDLPGAATGAPGGARVTLVDPGTAAADSAPAARSTAPTGLADSGGTADGSTSAAAAARPDVLTRAQWGADESIRGGGPSYGSIKAGFVHHTVNTNAYSAGEVPAMIRSIYRYHVLSRGWDDIGYNFVVDRFGRVWEGRHGGIDKPVIGAHTQGYNSQSFAMSALGDYSGASVPSAVEAAYARVYAWKLALHHVDPKGKAWLTRSGRPTFVTPTISGHRDAGSTACPGARLYARLPALREATARAQGAMFFNPRISPTRWTYGTEGPTSSLTARVRGRVEYRVEVRSSCAGLVRSRRGYASETAPIATGWSGRMADGSWAPPGDYTITLSAVDRSGESEPVPSWTVPIEIRATSSSPPSLCERTTP